MDKVIFMMPRYLLDNYIYKNFSKLTVEDFFLLVKRGVNVASLSYDKMINYLKVKGS